ncbi:MAG: MotA/TolQ/ExbB proton channel family protein [Spartobacteria bacterium]|nr:MotA/TolQ/ExbB proton channel family protein [Spartobacteria bacterium]
MNTRRWMWALILVAFIGSMMCAAYAQDPDAAAPDAPAKKMSLWDMLKQGGWAMWPLGLCSFFLITMVVINFRQVNRKKMMPPELVAQLKASAASDDVAGLWNSAQANECLFTRGLIAGVRHFNPEDPAASKTRMEDGISEVVGRMESQHSFWINFLSLVAAISPMIGLLGTVSGMIGAFQKIGSGGMGKPELLAADIGEALITTATGLVIAIPAMFFYFLFRNMLNRILSDSEEAYSDILDDLTGSGFSAFVAEEEEFAEEDGAE